LTSKDSFGNQQQKQKNNLFIHLNLKNKKENTAILRRFTSLHIKTKNVSQSDIFTNTSFDFRELFACPALPVRGGGPPPSP
jgi:hypothetical protein